MFVAKIDDLMVFVISHVFETNTDKSMEIACVLSQVTNPFSQILLFLQLPIIQASPMNGLI